MTSAPKVYLFVCNSMYKAEYRNAFEKLPFPKQKQISRIKRKRYTSIKFRNNVFLVAAKKVDSTLMTITAITSFIRQSLQIFYDEETTLYQKTEIVEFFRVYNEKEIRKFGKRKRKIDPAQYIIHNSNFLIFFHCVVFCESFSVFLVINLTSSILKTLSLL